MRDVLLHGHIFKNAGTTLDWSLHRSFKKHFLEHREDKQMRLHAQEVFAGALEDPALRAVSSHSMPSPAPSVEGVTFSMMLMLRHPLKRVRSVYDFERRQDAQTPGAVAAKEKDYTAYVMWRMQADVGPTIRNFQTRYVCGHDARRAQTEVGPEHFAAAAAQVIESQLFGVVERYDESMVVFEQSLCAKFPEIDLAYVPQNVTRSRFGSRKKSWYTDLGEAQTALIDNNAYDLALYQLANKQLDKRLSEVPDFDARISEFRGRCEALR